MLSRAIEKQDDIESSVDVVPWMATVDNTAAPLQPIAPGTLDDNRPSQTPQGRTANPTGATQTRKPAAVKDNPPKTGDASGTEWILRTGAMCVLTGTYRNIETDAET